MNSFGRLMTVEDLAKVLNVKKSWIRGAVFTKKIPYIKVGNLVRFREEELKNWILKNTVKIEKN